MGESEQGKGRNTMIHPHPDHRTLIPAVLALVQLSGFRGADREMEEGESHRGGETALKLSERKTKSQCHRKRGFQVAEAGERCQGTSNWVRTEDRRLVWGLGDSR